MSHLTIAQRYEIGVLRSQGFSISSIARAIAKDKSVVSRELKRNADGRNGFYKAELAQHKTEQRHASKPKFIQFTPTIQSVVVALLEEQYSPEQIVGRCEIINHPCVSIERIYQFIWADKKAKGMLYKHLRSKGKRYAKRGALKGCRGKIKGRIGIENRPIVVEDKERLGDFEADLVIGKNHKGALLTIVDRATGQLSMAKLKSKEASEVSLALIKLLSNVGYTINTITTDNGKEFANHLEVSNVLSIDYFFANPYASWERGANENLNGLIRQYFPKKHNFDLITEEQVNYVINKLNNRPRKRLNFLSPNEKLKLKNAA
jgi:transposase, IS30 family